MDFVQVAGVSCFIDKYGESLRYLTYPAISLVVQIEINHCIVANLIAKVLHTKIQVMR